MRYFIIICALVLTSGIALANGSETGHNNGGGHGNHRGDSSASSDATANANANVDASSTATTKHKRSSGGGGIALGYCQRGLDVRVPVGGGASGGTDDVCLLFALAELQFKHGYKNEGEENMKRANKILKIRTNPIRMYLQAIPIIGNWI